MVDRHLLARILPAEMDAQNSIFVLLRPNLKVLIYLHELIAWE